MLCYKFDSWPLPDYQFEKKAKIAILNTPDYSPVSGLSG